MINQAIIISDLHAGCRFGLCPPVDVPLIDGGTYRPSVIIEKAWGWWNILWGEWVPRVTHGEPFAVVLNGDAMDGRHHETVTQISQNIADQTVIAMMILAPVVAQCGGNFYMVRGTEAHAGKSGENEENLARELGAIPDGQGHHARWDLWLRIGGDRLAHIMHHIGTTGSMAYETTALMKEYSESCSEAARWGYPRPDWVIRSHRHRDAEIKVPTVNGYGICAVTPGWQLKTPLAYKIPGGRITTPQFGAILLRRGDEEHFTRHKVWNISRTPEVVL